MQDTQLDRVAIISMIVEAILYGILTMLCGFASWVLIFERGRNINKQLLTTLVSMYTLAVTHLIVNAYRLIHAFITIRNDPDEQFVYLNSLSSPTFLLKSSVYIIQTWTGDLCIIYRCFSVWRSTSSVHVIAIPLILFVGCTVAGVGLIVSFSRVTPAAEVFSFTGWATAFLCLTWTTNTLCTALIAFRIWSVDHASGKFCDLKSKSTLLPALVIIVESGAIYSASLIALLALYLSHSWAHFIILDSITPIIGIVFSMIIARQGLSIAWRAQTEPSIPTLQFGRLLRTMPKSNHPINLSVISGVTTETDKVHHSDIEDPHKSSIRDGPILPS